MTYLVDTDVLSIWQNGTGPEYALFALRASAHPTAEVGVSVVSFHEQMIGAKCVPESRSDERGRCRWV